MNGIVYPGVEILHLGKEDSDMKQTQSIAVSDDGNETEEVFRCMTCGAVIGHYGQGSFGTTKCPACKEDYRLDFKEDCPTLKRITRRTKGKSA